MRGIKSPGLRIFMIVGILVGLCVRWAIPSADPPLHRQTGAILYDEVWGFAARNAVLWGAWQQDEWRPWVVCPVHTILLEKSLRTFGVTPFGLRFLAMLSGTLILVYVYLMVRIARFSNGAALCASFVLATSWTMTGFSKTMTLEPSLMHFFAAALLCAVFAETRLRTRYFWYLAAGVCSGCAALCKTSGIPMALSLVPYFLAGTVLNGENQRWRSRISRTSAYLAGFGATFALGFWRWILPDLNSFYRLAVQTSLLDRAQSPWFMRAYKAIFWLDSQAFLTTPFWLCALFLLLPRYLASRNSPAVTREATPKKFVTRLMTTVFIAGLLIMINVDVPARRLVYLSVPFAVLTAALYDAIVQTDTSATEPALGSPGLAYRSCTVAACVAGGLIFVGWLISPNGGLPAFIQPRWAAWLLFDINAKITYKLVWLLAGTIMGILFYSIRDRIWRNRRNLLIYSLIAHGSFYLIASGLWFARLSYTGVNASHALGKAIPRGAFVLGADAAAQGYFNELRPVFWSPKVYRYANYDESRIARDFNPEFLVLTALDLERLRDGTYSGSPYIASFLDNEIARLPLYEYHESLSLDTELVLMRRRP